MTPQRRLAARGGCSSGWTRRCSTRTRSRSKASSRTQECQWRLSSTTGISPKTRPAGASLRFARALELNEAIQAVRRGPASLRIREVARDMAADLIVLGAQGKGAMETAHLGSVSLRLASETPCDVLLARIAR